ncbi:LysR substrate-binding domain-containing protein [Pseudomonas sp. GOM7]|uniref:LysR substrate-binding domain-containing protein n=1 Tax=Pseudomonas sp. GOM7 TaxID=2998079 RepID=UPI00227BAA9D|nr:LysR substrate-binding domain-containing protein [Pseudomonas sp. GOM7]WAJ36197.1 LysR substrate-binding domain-containing protein [Pseudomonas sp. GOM7]
MSQHREMQVFLAVAEAGSLAAAARALQLSQATVMRTLNALEQRLGSRLLRRGPRGVQLSPLGARFASHCQRILQRLEEAERSVTGLHARPAGQLTLALPLLMTHQVLMPIAVDYLAAFPEVSLATLAREELPRLLEEGIDLAVVVGHLPSSSGFAIPLGQVRPLVCAAPAYLERCGRPASPDELSAHRTIATSSTGHGGEWRFAGSVVKLAPRLICNTPQAAIRAALAGFGLTRCLSYEAHQELHSGQLLRVLEAFADAPVPVQLHYREGRRAAARVRSFLDFAVPRLRAHPAFQV